MHSSRSPFPFSCSVPLHFPILLLFLLLCLLLTPSLGQTPESSPLTDTVCRPSFMDLSLQLGLQHPLGRRLKYGGPCIADLNGDGRVDLLFGHHDDRWADAYFFSPSNKTFTKYPWRLWVDAHGFSAFRAAPWQKTMHFLVTRGGQRNQVPNAPELFRVVRKWRPRRSEIVEVDPIGDLGVYARGRGRSALVINLRRWVARPDIIMLNAPRKGFTIYSHTMYAIKQRSTFVFKNVSESTWNGFTTDTNYYAVATDLDNDGKLEVITYQNARMYKRTADYTLDEISDTTLPAVERRGVSAAAEADFNNDGWFDVYLSRSARGELKWLRRVLGDRTHDYVLWNNQGHGYELRQELVPEEVKAGSFSMGVTVGDFDNDGWVDIFVPQYDNGGVDYILMNNGARMRGADGDEKWFTVINAAEVGIHRPSDVAGDHGVAVDYDEDGRVDIIASQGEWFDKSLTGNYHIFHNSMDRNKNNFVLVRVRNAPGRRATSLHAVVQTCVLARFVVDYDYGDDNEEELVCMKRRVGTQGAAVSQSLIETLHFGVGTATRIESVTTTWIDGSTERRTGLAVGRKIIMGTA